MSLKGEVLIFFFMSSQWLLVKKTENQSPEYLWKANESTVMGPNAYKSI